MLIESDNFPESFSFFRSFVGFGGFGFAAKVFILWIFE